jgi:hypothetical protein
MFKAAVQVERVPFASATLSRFWNVPACWLCRVQAKAGHRGSSLMTSLCSDCNMAEVTSRGDLSSALGVFLESLTSLFLQRLLSRALLCVNS